MSTITLKRVAELANVSPSTVSSVLNNNPNRPISPQMRERVMRIASKYNYRPNFGVKLLQGVDTNTVAILQTHPTFQFEEHLNKLNILLLSQLDASGCSCYQSFCGAPEANMEKVRELASRGAQRFILIGSPQGEVELCEQLDAMRRPYVFFHGSPGCPRNVTSDTQPGIEQILRHFVQAGRTDIRVIRLRWDRKGEIRDTPRFRALARVFPDLSHEELERRHFVDVQDFFTSRDYTDIVTVAQAGEEATRRILARGPCPSALLYYNDIMALGGVRALHAAGLAVGEDVWVAGVNDTDAVRAHVFPILSVRHDLEAIAKALLEGCFAEGRFHRAIPAAAVLRPAASPGMEQ